MKSYSMTHYTLKYHSPSTSTRSRNIRRRSAEHCLEEAECVTWLLLSSPTRVSRLNCVSVLLLHCSGRREAGDEGGKFEQQRDAEFVSVAVHRQGPAGKSCGKEVMVCVVGSVFIIKKYIRFKGGGSFLFFKSTFDSLKLLLHWLWSDRSKCPYCQHELHHSQT